MKKKFQLIRHKNYVKFWKNRDMTSCAGMQVYLEFIQRFKNEENIKKTQMNESYQTLEPSFAPDRVSKLKNFIETRNPSFAPRRT